MLKPEKFKQVMAMNMPKGWEFDMRSRYANHSNKSCCFYGVIELNGIMPRQDNESTFDDHLLEPPARAAYKVLHYTCPLQWATWDKIDNTFIGAKARTLYYQEGGDLKKLNAMSKQKYNAIIKPFKTRVKNWKS